MARPVPSPSRVRLPPALHTLRVAWGFFSVKPSAVLPAVSEFTSVLAPTPQGQESLGVVPTEGKLPHLGDRFAIGTDTSMGG